jgi:hypothetical protein
MRPVFTCTLFLLFIISSKAQINNSGFENWTNMGSYEVPDQWGTLNHATSHLNVYTVTKWNPGSPGAYFMKITSKAYGMSILSGIAVYGALDSTTLQPLTGYPYTQRPVSFTGQWQHMIWGSDQGSVCATLTKWNISENKRDTIAIAYEELFDMAMQWEAFSIDFNYTSTDLPDSCMIVLKASGATPTLNDYLWVDDLAFSGFVGMDDPALSNQLNVYPVPSCDDVTIDIRSDKPQNITLEIVDMAGRIIISQKKKLHPGDHQLKIDVSSFANGTYFLRSVMEDQTFFRKIIVNSSAH